MSGMGLTQMNSLLSLNSAMKNTETLGTARTGLQSRLRTETDETMKAALEERLKSVEQKMSDGVNGINEHISADREKIAAEGSGNSEIESGVSAVPEAGAAGDEEAVTVVISPEGKIAAASGKQSEHTRKPVRHVQTPEPGNTVNIKV